MHSKVLCVKNPKARNDIEWDWILGVTLKVAVACSLPTASTNRPALCIRTFTNSNAKFGVSVPKRTKGKKCLP